MADNVLNKRFFTNTYITGSGRHNYLRIDHLEDPLFTSFTFDIDYVTSPLFYTIGYSEYGYPNTEGLAANIEEALSGMYAEYMSNDQGYDILPVFSASILDGNKLGFGLQQNVYMDMPLYGATEYIYMVDKRNGGADQNDAGYDSNQFLESGSNPNTLNSFKLGASLNSIVNDSDKAWAERRSEENKKQVDACQEIMDDPTVKNEHEENSKELYGTPDKDGNLVGGAYNNMLDANKYTVKEKDANGKEIEVVYTEAELMDKVKIYKELDNEIEYFQREIVEWANETLSSYKSRGTSIYNDNKCVQKIMGFETLDSGNKNECAGKLEKEFGDDFRDKYLFKSDESYFFKFLNLYFELETYHNDQQMHFYNGQLKKWYYNKTDDGNSFLYDHNIRKSKIIEKFRNRLEYFGMLNTNAKGEESIDFDVAVKDIGNSPDWANDPFDRLSYFAAEGDFTHMNDLVRFIMTYNCDIESSFDEKFTSKKVEENKDMLDIYEEALDQIRYNLYGVHPDGSGNPGDSSNPDPYSPYGEYLAAKEKYENDDYSQAEKSLKLAQSGVNQMTSMIGRDEYNQEIKDENYNESVNKDTQPLEVSRSKSIVTAQTVLDMLGFINGMKKMTMHYPYIIQGVSGLDTAYNKHYGIKDPYLGSGDDKITLTCLESLDLRVSSMFNRYFNAVYDRQYRRERVPVNLRRFNCSIYVHDVRNFMPKDRVDKNGERIVTYNRLLELTDMYYSVIEFRFFDCEIVPEETGNIFNDVSNESPSEMKKTNFTFTYGNCVVNFVPPSEVAAHKTSKPRI